MNICIFGDSIVWGASDYQRGGYVEQLKSYCLENYDDVNVYNLGIPGNTTNDLLKRFKSEAITRNSEMIIFAIGINDSSYIKDENKNLVNIKQFNKNLLKLIKLARKTNSKIIFFGLTRVDESKTMPVYWDAKVYYDNESLEKYDLAIKNICEKNNLDYIQMKDVVLISDLDDGLHPNSIGHEKMFKEVLKNIEKYIK